MSLLNEIRRFISKWIKNPIVLAAVAYIIYRTLRNYTKKENFNKRKIESILVLQRKDNEEVIYDSNTKMYARIKGDEVIETSNKEIKI